MTKPPKELPRSTIDYRYNRLMPIPYRSIVRTSSSGHAAGRMSPRHSAGSTDGGMLQAVPAPPTDPGSVASDLAPTPRQLVGSGRRDHPPIQMDSDLRKRPIDQVVGDLIDDEVARCSPTAARGRAARRRRDMSKVFALPGRCREPPRPRAKPSTYDEPSEPLTAPIQTARPRGSRSSPAAAQRGRKAQGLDGEPRGRGTIAVPTGYREVQPIPLHRRTTPPRCSDPIEPPITHKFSPGNHSQRPSASAISVRPCLSPAGA